MITAAIWYFRTTYLLKYAYLHSSYIIIDYSKINFMFEYGYNYERVNRSSLYALILFGVKEIFQQYIVLRNSSFAYC